MRRLAILGSTNGTDMLAIIQAIATKRLNASIEVVISNKKNAGILMKASEHNIKGIYLDPKSTDYYDQLLSVTLQQFQPDLIVLIGYMRILSPQFIQSWPNQIINVHPSLLPAFAGGMNKAVHQAVLDAGISETGCTVHLVTEEIDAGPILLQKKCPIFQWDTVDTVKQRVQTLEGEALIEVIQHLPTYLKNCSIYKVYS